MKTTIELPDELFIEAKKHAAGHRTTMRALIERGLRHELQRRTKSAKNRHGIKWVTVPGGAPTGMNVADRKSMMERLLRDRA